MRFADRSIGIYHFLFDRVAANIAEVPPKPRKQNHWLENGKSIIAGIDTGNNIRRSVDQALALLGPLSAAISRGDKVMVKPNFNSDDPPPASTDLQFLKVIIEVLLELGAKVTIGESSGGVWRPTTKVFQKLHLFELARTLGVDLIAFEAKEKEWVRIRIDGDYLRSVVMPKSAYEADRLIYLPCLKTHRLAKYSGALKLAFGFVHPGERRAFHLRFREEKLAEISLCWQPDLIIMDGRKAFIRGGPNRGQVVEPKIILASGDLIAIDVEAIKVLLSYKAENKLPVDPWQLAQITTALKHKLGSGKNDYVLKTI
jgi:uncharacterized protein (DUF362 family)